MLTKYADFEGMMIHLAKEKGWQFSFSDEEIPLSVVFNRAMYAPPLLSATQQELDSRGVSVDLGFQLQGESTSLFGAKVVFHEAEQSILSQIWRLAAVSWMIESLPVVKARIQLDPLQYVLGDRYAQFVTNAKVA